MGWVVNATIRPLYPGKEPVPIAQEDGWAPGPVWTVTENLVPPTRIRSPDRPARSESLYRLSYPGPQGYKLRNIKCPDGDTNQISYTGSHILST